MQEPAVRQRFNPLRMLWNILGTIGGVLSLSSMVQNWLSDLFRWQGFVATLVEAYRSVMLPVMDLLFGWLPFVVPAWIGDYIVLGALVTVSWARALGPSERSPSEWISLGVLACLLWPVAIFNSLMLLRTMRQRARPGSVFEGSPQLLKDQEEKRRMAAFYQWLGALFLGLIVLLAVSAAL